MFPVHLLLKSLLKLTVEDRRRINVTNQEEENRASDETDEEKEITVASIELKKDVLM